jgi:predicted RNA methylase
LFYSCTVPKDIFNPYGSVVPKRMVELILDGTVLVQARQVIDLGCGCGLLGLASILKGCQQVLFTDINPHIITLQEHSLLREADTIKVQDILVNELDASWDLIIASPPSQPTEQQVTADNLNN